MGGAISIIQEAAPDPLMINDTPIKNLPQRRAATAKLISMHDLSKKTVNSPFGAAVDITDPTREIKEPMNKPHLRPNLSSIGSAMGNPTMHPMLMMATRSPNILESRSKSALR